MIRIFIAGYKGKMGSTCVNMVMAQADFQLVGVLDHNATIDELELQVDQTTLTVPVFKQNKDIIGRIQADVWIDFTTPAAVTSNTKFALENGICPVVGTTGITESDLAELQQLADTKKMGGLIAPNFAIGAVLMMQFAQKAAHYFPNVEIIELHHDQKLDAPSGTALKTAELIQQVRGDHRSGHPNQTETLSGALGALYGGIPIHSVRLPGLVAHQEVLFGGAGEGLKIRHDSFDRSSFMHGVALACRRVVELDKLYYGLEWIL